ncbi:nitroreductase family protein [Guyparkeria sp. GHLCS8-2]|uniref:Acg family FMN-binding oxidoreductase n=1 Tax=Guyparkeria halopsychrophila TaxID=3139421 RepID=UPI0037C8B530
MREELGRTVAKGVLDHDRVRGLIENAAAAPSSHNTQPWHFRIETNGVSIHADTERRLPVNDPADRELTISCGCALMNLRVAAAAAGQAYRLELLPEGEGAACLARVTWQEGDADAEEASLGSVLARRRTYRKQFAPSTVPREASEALEAMAEREGAWLQVIESGEPRWEVARLVAEGDASQWRDPRWREELADWMRPVRQRDGLSVPALLAPVVRAVVRKFDMSRRVGKHDRELTENAPLLVALGTEGDGRRDWLKAGLALERVLLAACQVGMQASYLNQPIQVSSLRDQLHTVLNRPGHPQVLLRLGYPPGELPATPRRPLADLMLPVRD